MVLGPRNCFYWGAAAPQTPCSSWGASSPLDPLAGGLQPPVPPCIPRGSASRALRRSWYQGLGTKILVPRSWYQDLGTKIYGEPERRSLSVCRGARGAAGPPPGGQEGWKPPRKSRGSGGRQPPSKNNFVDPEPPSDHLKPPSTDHLFITIVRKKVNPITTPPDKVFERPG